MQHQPGDYIYRTEWPPTTSSGQETIPPHTHKCTGIIYTVRQAPLPDMVSFQQLTCHLWSTVLQTPFYKCPLAIVVQDKQDILLPMLPNIIKLHHVMEYMQPYVQIFETTAEAESWLEKKCDTRLTPVTYPLH